MILMAEKQNLNYDFPEELERIMKGYTWEDHTFGYSGTHAFKLISHQKNLFLKINHPKSEFNLEREKFILEWLEGKLPVPKVMYFGKKDNIEFLLVSEIQGQNSHTFKTNSEKRICIKVLAETLRKIHKIDAKKCPIDNNPDRLLEIAKKKMEEFDLDPGQFDERWQNRKPRELYEEILKVKPETYDLVFSHGDYCLPNIIIKDNLLSGLIDWPYGGINDRYFDLAAVIWSIGYNYGDEWVPLFFERYGINDIDWDKIKFFQMLNEFFQQ